jgi:polysaccharide export outer membrane protein
MKARNTRTRLRAVAGGAVLLWSILAGAATGQTTSAAHPTVPRAAAATSSGLGIDSRSERPALDAQAVGAVAHQLGVSAEEAARLKGAMNQNGGNLSSDQLEELCVRLGAKGLGGESADAIIHSLGISEEQIAQVKSCLAQAVITPSSAVPASPSQGRTPQEHQPSSIEKEYLATNSGEPILQFGYSLFSGPVSTFAPVNDVPVSDDYAMGPGDELKILFWGRINRTLSVPVQRDGTALVDQLGPLQVGGLTFAQAKRLIENKATQITGVQVQATLGKLRTIQVFVMGEVEQPGAYTISALAHVSNALVAAGGIRKIGSLRRIQLRRRSQPPQAFDLYDLLLRGDATADQQLRTNDVVFVPVIGAVVAVAGDVKRPGIYELSAASEGLDRALQLTGGISAFGYLRRIKISRVQNHERRIIVDANLSELRPERLEVRDGDLVRVFPVLTDEDNAVACEGNVRRPGQYQWRTSMRVADLVKEAEGVARRTYFQYALVRRIAEPEGNVTFLPVDLGAALNDDSSHANVLLRPRDTLTIYSNDEIRDLPVVRIVGEVRKPGEYQLAQGMKASDLIYLGGGLKYEAYQVQAELARTEVIDGQSTRRTNIDLDLRKVLGEGGSEDIALVRNDEIFVRRAPGWHLPWIVNVDGEVLRPGPYAISGGERLSSLLERCGEILPEAYPQGAVLLRKSIREVERKRLDESRIRLQRDFANAQMRALSVAGDKASANANDVSYLQRLLEETQNQQPQGRLVIHLRSAQQLARTEDDVMLEEGDALTVPRRPASVSVLGQVSNVTALVFRPSLTVQDYLDRAGGTTEGADTSRVVVVKVDGSVFTADGWRNQNEGRLFPALPVFSGGLMTAHLEPGDTVYVPERLALTNNIQLVKDVATIIGQSISALSVIALLAFK